MLASMYLSEVKNPAKVSLGSKREIIQCSMCRNHVHSSCDPEATEEKILERRAVQFNYMYVCKICKGHQDRITSLIGNIIKNLMLSSIVS